MCVSMFYFCLPVSILSNALKYRTLRHLEIAIVQMKIKMIAKKKLLEKDLKRFMVTDIHFNALKGKKRLRKKIKK